MAYGSLFIALSFFNEPYLFSVNTEHGEQKEHKGKSVVTVESEGETKVPFCRKIETKKNKLIHENLKMVETPRAKRRQHLLLEKITELKVVEGLFRIL